MWICSQHWNPRHIRWLKTDSVVWLCRGFRSALRFFHDLIMTISSRRSEVMITTNGWNPQTYKMQQLAQSSGQQLQQDLLLFHTNWVPWDLGLVRISLAFESWILNPHPAALSQSKNSTIPGPNSPRSHKQPEINVGGSMWATRKKKTGLTDSILHVTPQKFNGWNLKRSPWKRDSELGKHHFSGSMLKFRGSILVV